MDYKEVIDLIEKYFLAETSIEEERSLKEYFSGNDVHPGLQIYYPVFKNEIPDELSSEFDEKILSLIDKEMPVQKPAPVKKMFPGRLKIAAIFILILAGSIIWYSQVQQEKNKSPEYAKAENVPSEIKDTYNHPEQARKELEKALALLSSKMNRANEATAEQVSRLDVISKVIPESN